MDTKKLRQKILDLAIRGKLVPQDPNDEPASVLLERIREEKKQMVKEGKLKAKDIQNDTIIFKGEDNLHYEKFRDETVKCIEDEIPFEVPEGWEWERLSNIASFSGGKTPSTSNKGYWNGSVLWVTSKDMKSKYIETSQLMLSDEGASLMQFYPVDTVLMVTRSGVLRHTLPIAILKKDATINQDIKAISLYNHSLSEWLYSCLKGMEDILLLKFMKSGTTVENINFDEFKKLLLPIPPMEEIRRIITQVLRVVDKADTIDDGKANLTELINQTKSKILDCAIRGKLVPQNSRDEQASVLLERIRAEKEAQIKQGGIKRDKQESIIYKGDDNSYYEKFQDGTVKCIDNEIPFDVPSGWEWLRGSSCFMPMTSRKPTAGKFKYIDIDSIDNQRQEIKAPKVIDAANAPSRASRAVYEGSVLFSLVRPYLKNIALVNKHDADSIASTGFYVATSNGVFTPQFLYILMTTPYVINGLNHFIKGDNSPSINLNDVEKWIYPVPPLSEQIRISDGVFKLFDLIKGIESSLK